MSAIIDYLTSWNNTDDVETFGYFPDTSPGYGQSFKTPDSTNTALKTFTFVSNIPSTLNFIPSLYEFDNDTGLVIGSPLFTGPQMSGFVSGYNQIEINLGSVNLDSTKTYLMFVCTNGLSGSGTGAFGANNSADYPDGFFAFNNHNNVINMPWGVGFTGDNPMAFKATFDIPTSSPSQSYLYQTP